MRSRILIAVPFMAVAVITIAWGSLSIFFAVMPATQPPEEPVVVAEWPPVPLRKGMTSQEVWAALKAEGYDTWPHSEGWDQEEFVSQPDRFGVCREVIVHYADETGKFNKDRIDDCLLANWTTNDFKPCPPPKPSWWDQILKAFGL